MYQIQLPKVKIDNLSSQVISTYNEAIIVHYDLEEFQIPDAPFYEVELDSANGGKILIKGTKTIEYFEAKNFKMHVYNEEH